MREEEKRVEGIVLQNQFFAKKKGEICLKISYFF